MVKELIVSTCNEIPTCSLLVILCPNIQLIMEAVTLEYQTYVSRKNRDKRFRLNRMYIPSVIFIFMEHITKAETRILAYSKNLCC